MTKIKEFAERFSFFTPDKDRDYLRRTFELALKSRESGNTPFASILVDQDGNILLEQMNIEIVERDCTGHAETTLAKNAFQRFTKEELWNCSLYTNCEPCCMCAGAIYWSNIGRIVFAMSENDLFATTKDHEMNPSFNHNCRDILSKGQKDIVVCGPYPELKEEAMVPHLGFWD